MDHCRNLSISHEKLQGFDFRPRSAFLSSGAPGGAVPSWLRRTDYRVPAACSIIFATSFGWESMTRWLEANVMEVAFIIFASSFSSSGGIARSLLAITNQDGLVFHAAVVMVAPKA